MASPRKKPTRKTRVPVRSSLGRGRPAIEDTSSLLEIWLFVEENIYRSRNSVNEICNTSTFGFWGIGAKLTRHRSLSGASLRRRYYEAEALLKKEIKLHEENRDAFARLGATFSHMLPEPRLVTYWNEELMRRMRAN